MRTIRYVISFLLLIFSWVFLFYILTIFTVFTLAPWDTAIDRPPLGVWQRTLNDFFERSPGQFSIAAVVVVVSIALAFRTLRRSPQQVLRLAITNSIYILAVIPVYMLTATLNNLIFPYPPVLYDPNFIGYHRSVLPTMAVLTVTLIWLMYQQRVSKASTGMLTAAVL